MTEPRTPPANSPGWTGMLTCDCGGSPVRKDCNMCEACIQKAEGRETVRIEREPAAESSEIKRLSEDVARLRRKLTDARAERDAYVKALDRAHQALQRALGRQGLLKWLADGAGLVRSAVRRVRG